MEVPRDFEHLPERPVTAVKVISKEMKNISARKGRDNILAELIGEETLSSGSSVPAQNVSATREHPLKYEEAGVIFPPHTDVVEQGDDFVEDAKFSYIDYDETSDVLSSSFMEVAIDDKHQNEDDGELYGTFNNGRNNVSFLAKSHQHSKQMASAQSLSADANSEAKSKTFSEFGTLMFQSRQGQEPVPPATYATAEDTMGRAEVAARCFGEQQVEGITRKKNTDLSKDRSSASSESPSPGNVREKKKINCKSSTCKRKLASKDLSDHHLHNHSNGRQLQSRESRTAVSHSSTLARQVHARARDPVYTDMEGRRFKCNQCGKAFKTSNHLITHVRIHTGERPFQCDRCGKVFKSSQELTSHMRVHSLEKPFKCCVCNKAFKRKENLNAHTNIHTGKNSYLCSTCGRSISNKSNFLAHLRIHVEDKPYKCSTCGKSFARSTSRTVHMRVHTGERPYKCTICGKQTTTASNLNSHTRSMHSASTSAY